MFAAGAVELGVAEAVHPAVGRGHPVAVARGVGATPTTGPFATPSAPPSPGRAEVERPALGGDQGVADRGRDGRAGRRGRDRQGDRRAEGAGQHRRRHPAAPRRARRFARTGDAATLPVTSWDTNRSSRGCLTAVRPPSFLGVFLSGEAELFLTKRQTAVSSAGTFNPRSLSSVAPPVGTSEQGGPVASRQILREA